VKHIRSARNLALVSSLKRGRRNSLQKQRPLAKRLRRSQSWLANIETMQRRCDVLEFVDLGDAMYEDRMALFRDLLAQSPRRFFPPKVIKAAPQPIRAASTKAKKARKESKKRIHPRGDNLTRRRRVQ
jgi:hypothetical protein